MGADRFTLTMYLALGTEKGITTSTREDRVSDETVFREARSVMSLNKKKLILSKFSGVTGNKIIPGILHHIENTPLNCVSISLS